MWGKLHAYLFQEALGKRREGRWASGRLRDPKDEENKKVGRNGEIWSKKKQARYISDKGTPSPPSLTVATSPNPTGRSTEGRFHQWGVSKAKGSQATVQIF